MASLPNIAGVIKGLDRGNLIGASVAVVAGIVSNLGTNMQKMSHNANAKRPVAERLHPMQRGDWWCGMGAVLFGAVADFFALGIADQTIVSALGGGTVLVTNVVIAKYWNGEHLFDKDLYGVACVTVGALIFSLTATEAKGYTLEQLEYRLKRPGFVAYTVVTCVLMLFLVATISTSSVHKFAVRCFCGADRGGGHGGMDGEDGPALEGGEASPILGGGGGGGGGGSSSTSAEGGRKSPSGAKGAGRRLTRRPSRFFDHWYDQYIYAGCAGIVGAMSVLMGGCVSKLLIVTLQGGQALAQFRGSDPWPFFFIGAVVLTTVGQTYLLNCAMMMGDTMTVFPFFQVFWIVFSVSGGIVFYQQGALNLVGLGFVALGVAFLVQHGKLKRFRRRAGDDAEPGEMPGETVSEEQVAIQNDVHSGTA
jgi:hypothetical protein